MLLSLFLLLTARGVYGTNPPHIIFLVGDDIGWNDVGWNNPNIKTPNLQYLANNGVILNSSYVQPLCTPTRSSFLTGVYPYRMGLQSGVMDMLKPEFLSTSYPTLPERLSEQGYASHMVGKWHLGHCNWTYTPTGRGFDSHNGLLLGSGDHYSHERGTKVASGGRETGFDFWSNQVVNHTFDGVHSTDAFTTLAVETIENHDVNTPLFLYVAYTAAHTPLQEEDNFTAMYNDSHGDSSRQTFSAMVTHLDDSVGQIVTALEGRGMMDNLILAFISDNGGDPDKGASNTPLQGKKGDLYEGGTRTPAVVYSQTLLNQTGYTQSGMMHAVDWFATFLDVAGISHSGVDGVSQWDMISNGGNSGRTEMVYNINNSTGKMAIRMGDYKLLRGVSRRDKVFNVKDDPEESTDLYGRRDPTTQSLQNRLAQLLVDEVAPPVVSEDPASYPSNNNGIWSPGWCTGGL